MSERQSKISQSIYHPIMKVNTGYHDPELDTSPELDPDAVSYYLTIISILRWMIELGRIDIIT